MLRIQKLNRPNKRSGYRLEPGKTTEVRGLVVTNKTKSTLFVDKFTTPIKKKKAKKKAKKK